MIEWVEAHMGLAFAGVVTTLLAVLGAQVSRLLSRMRYNQALTARDVTNGILETFARQAVRFAEEQARKLDDLKMPSDEKLYLAVEFVKQNAGLAGIDPGPAENVVALVEGSLAAERKFLEDFDIDSGEFDPRVLEAILEGEKELRERPQAVQRLEEVEADGPSEADAGTATPTG
jgi:hypothetical protein